MDYKRVVTGRWRVFKFPASSTIQLVLLFGGFFCLVCVPSKLERALAHPTFCPTKLSQVFSVGKPCIWSVVEELLIALLLRTRDLVREEVGCIDGIFLRVAWSELEDEIKQFIGSPVFDDIGGDFVRLEDRLAR